MSSAFWEPPDSGVSASASADGAHTRDAKTTAVRAVRSRRLGVPAGKAAGSYPRPPGGLHFVPDAPSEPELRALERRIALLREGGNALLEVHRPGERVLELRLQVELAVEVRVEHPVERLLRARVGARGPGGELRDQRVRLLHEAVVGMH